MKTSLIVDNVKCGGCANSITKKLSKIVNDVKLDEVVGRIEFTYEEDEQVNLAIEALRSMGYPPQGESTMTDKAKSYMSCMIGRIT